MMRPYTGMNFQTPDRPALLLIGESHYLPSDSRLDVTPDVWYSGSAERLNDDERGFINTKEIIEESAISRFSNKAHSIWRNSLSVINESGPAYSDYVQVAHDIAFYNFFLRPAFTGDSLVVQPIDEEFANEAFVEHYQELKPTAVVFLSSLAYRHFRHPASATVPFIVTPHPGCQWWNRVAKKYGNKRGRDTLRDFIQTLNWPKELTGTPKL